MKIWAAKCSICAGWYALEAMPLVWQLSEGVFRGVCEVCNDDIQAKAKTLDWSKDGSNS
jgi:hypothetical protein